MSERRFIGMRIRRIEAVSPVWSSQSEHGNLLQDRTQKYVSGEGVRKLCYGDSYMLSLSFGTCWLLFLTISFWLWYVRSCEIFMGDLDGEFC